MILVRLMGGLGNQMFQYATAYAVALRNKTAVKIDTTLLDENKNNPHHIVTHRDLDLEIFKIDLLRASQKEIEYFNGKTYQNIFGKAFNKLLFQFRKNNLAIEKDRAFQPEILKLQDNKCLVGAWQSAKYFDDFESQIKTLFAFQNPVLEKSKDLLNDIKNSESICVNVRRGDYITSPIYSKNIGAKSADYYNEGIKYFENKFSNANVFVFSDDIDWCKENLQSKFSITFVTNEHAGEKYSNKLQLMIACKHFVISNSTYAWWGAWLSNNKDKVVVAPKVWALNPDSFPKDIIPDDWIMIDK